MKLGIVIAGCLLALGAAGCASSTQLEDKARVHQLRADAAAQSQDYEKAAEEQEKAQRLHEKAVERAYKEGKAGEVVVPSDVPYPPPPPPRG